MFEAVVLVIHLIVALGIIAVVLVQPAESGGFLGNSGSMSNMMVQRRTGDVLTRVTTILAGCFFLTSLMLAIIAERRGPETSILDAATEQSAPAAVAGKKMPATEKTAPAVPVATPPVKAEEPKKEKPAAPISK